MIEWLQHELSHSPEILLFYHLQLVSGLVSFNLADSSLVALLVRFLLQ